MIRKLAVGAILSMALLACGGGQENGEDGDAWRTPGTQTELRRAMMAEIDSLETIVTADTFFTRKSASAELLAKYEKYASTFPGDQSKTPEYLYKAGALARGIGQPLQALRAYDLILRKYRDFERNPEVAFLIAFTYDADMNNPELARESYEEVVNRYPDDAWAVQARQRLETIGMTDEELIEFLMQQNGGNL
jgi:tetratricopeptide (TPR) repeat protein